MRARFGRALARPSGRWSLESRAPAPTGDDESRVGTRTLHLRDPAAQPLGGRILSTRAWKSESRGCALIPRPLGRAEAGEARASCGPLAWPARDGGHVPDAREVTARARSARE